VTLWRAGHLVVQVGMSKISGCTISLQAAVHPRALATGTQHKKNVSRGSYISTAIRLCGGRTRDHVWIIGRGEKFFFFSKSPWTGNWWPSIFLPTPGGERGKAAEGMKLTTVEVKNGGVITLPHPPGRHTLPRERTPSCSSTISIAVQAQNHCLALLSLFYRQTEESHAFQ